MPSSLTGWVCITIGGRLTSCCHNYLELSAGDVVDQPGLSSSTLCDFSSTLWSLSTSSWERSSPRTSTGPWTSVSSSTEDVLPAPPSLSHCKDKQQCYSVCWEGDNLPSPPGLWDVQVRLWLTSSHPGQQHFETLEGGCTSSDSHSNTSHLYTLINYNF